MKDKVLKLIQKYEELESELSRPEVIADQTNYTRLRKTFKGIEKATTKGREFIQMSNDLTEWQLALNDPDPELNQCAKEEVKSLESKIAELTEELQILMVPKEPWDYRNATLEIRGGTGGDESSLFAGDLFRMYRGYCDRMGWRMSILNASEGTVGGFKEISAFIEGDSVYGKNLNN